MKPFATALAVILAAVAHAQTVIAVDATANRHSINPLIYGIAWASTAQLQDLNYTFNRAGGNEMSNYNWLADATMKGADWYFESRSVGSPVPGYQNDSFMQATKAAGAQAGIAIPIMPYLAKTNDQWPILPSFSVRKYGPQTGSDPWYPDAGNGVSAVTGRNIVNDPLDAAIPNSVDDQGKWIDHMISRWGLSNNGGLKYYLMDNEVSIWFATHRDVHPVGPKMQEILDDYLSYAAAIRKRDRDAWIMGPEEWGWNGYFYSGYDQWYGGGYHPDRAAHGNMDYVPWLLRQLDLHERETGERLLNVLSLHYYPQQGETSDDDSAGMQAIRNRSTRSLWDPNYVDTSWIGSIVDLIPRMKNWTRIYYPGTFTAITEYNWGDESELNGATTQADILGIFGREGLDMASRWGTPTTNNPTYLAMKIYRNYDGRNSSFGSTSCSCQVPDPDQLSAFAAQRPDGTMTIMVINKVTTSAPIAVEVSGQGLASTASAYQISSTAQNSINQIADVSVTNGTISTTVPAQSVTLFVVGTGSSRLTWQYDFEDGTDGWDKSGAPITSVAQSTSQHFSGSNSLAVNISGASGSPYAYVSSPSTPAGATVTYHVWIPANSQITAIQPYVLQGAAGGWTWTGNYQSISSLQTNAWNTLTVTVPSNAVVPLYQLGVQFFTGATWTGTCYIDAVGW